MALGLTKKKTAPAPKAVKPSHVGAKIDNAPNPPAPAAPHKFTPRQALFMDHWMILRNATQAAIAAGFSKRTAPAQGSRLFNNVKVRAELDRRMVAQSGRMEVTADRVIGELARIAFVDMASFMRPNDDGSPVLDFSALTADQSACLSSVTVEEFKDGRSDKREVRRTKFQLWDKVKALELLGKKFKLFGDYVEHDHKHELTLFQYMLDKIDADARGKVIEHQK